MNVIGTSIKGDRPDRLATTRTLHLSDFSGISDSDDGENAEEMFDPPSRGGYKRLPVVSSSESEVYPQQAKDRNQIPERS